MALFWTVWESLYMTDNSDSVQIVPVLATSFKTPDDGRTFDFELRKGVKFHNGDILTATDAAWTLNTFKMTNNYYTQSFDHAEAIDDLHVRVHLKEKDFTLINTLAWEGWILPKKYWEKVGGADGFAAAPVGTGPYRLTKFVPNDYFEMEPFADHWRQQKPYFEKIVVRLVPEPATQITMLKAGDADVVWGSTPKLWVSTQKEKGIKGTVVAGGRITAFAMNQAQVEHWKLDDPRVKPFADEKVRQAANYAINRDEIVNSLWLGQVKPVPSVFAPTVLPSPPDLKPYPYDPNKARDLLKEAGYPNGFDTIMYGPATGGYVLEQEMDQVIADYLTKVGIRVKTQLLEAGILEQKTATSKDVNPIIQIRRGATIRHPSNVGKDLSCPTSINDTDGHFCDPEMQKRMNAGKAIGDASELQKYYQSLERDFQPLAPWIFLWEDPDYFLMRDDIDWKIVGGTNYRYNMWTARRT